MSKKENIDAKIFVGNVAFTCVENDFINCFKNMKGFVKAEIIKKYNSELSRGFGFVTFDSDINANHLLEQKEIVLDNRKLRFSKYSLNNKPQISNQTQKYKLFIKNTPSNMKTEELSKVFSKYGAVDVCYFNTDIKTGSPKNTAVIELKDKESYLKAINDKNVEYNKTQLEINPLIYKQTKKYNNVFNRDTTYKKGFNAGKMFGIQIGLNLKKKR